MTESFYQQEQIIKSHYEKIADNYDVFWGNSADIVEYYSNQIVKYLDLKSTDVFVDLGCGTGIYTKKIRGIAQLINPVLCVDISAKMLKKIPDNAQFKPILMDAVEFSEQPRQYDKVLMQGMTHHILDKGKLIKNLTKRLNPGGKILTTGLPYRLEYPLFEKVLETYQDLYYKGESSVDLFLELGFEVKLRYVRYPISVEKYKYLEMVRNRYISTLLSFSEQEIEDGLKEIEAKYRNESILNFNECFLFILISKPAND